MQGLASPIDFYDAWQTAQRVESALPARLEASREEILLDLDWDYLRPDRALLKVMDRMHEANEERRTNRKRSSAFEDIIAARVAAAAVPVFAGENGLTPDLTLDEPFSPAAVLAAIVKRRADRKTG